MKFLPIEKITYRTKLDEVTISERLLSIMEPKQTMRFTGFFAGKKHKPYEGHVLNNTFTMNRIINYRNSFIPQITGIYKKDMFGTEIKVVMKMHLIVNIFMGIWLGIIGLVCLGIIPTFFINEKFEPMLLVPYGMFFFGYALAMGAFKFESNKSKIYIAELLEAEIED